MSHFPHHPGNPNPHPLSPHHQPPQQLPSTSTSFVLVYTTFTQPPEYIQGNGLAAFMTEQAARSELQAKRYAHHRAQQVTAIVGEDGETVWFPQGVQAPVDVLMLQERVAYEERGKEVREKVVSYVYWVERVESVSGS